MAMSRSRFAPISCADAINAGVDMIVVPYEWKKFLDNIVSQVKSGSISRAALMMRCVAFCASSSVLVL